MIYCNVVNVVIVTLIASVSAIPDKLLCCPPTTGTFLYLRSNDTGCWDEQSNKTNPFPLTCSEFNVFQQEYFNLNVTESGQVFHSEPDAETSFEFKLGEACFGDETHPETNETVSMVVACAVEEKDDRILGYSMLVSSVFLFLTTVVYAVLPEIRDLQGKSIINFCGSMGIGLAILSSAKLTQSRNMIECVLRGFTIYLFLVASFFWTNAISIQILLSLRRPVVNNYSWKAFSWYALYAWGCPIILTVCMAIVNYHPGDHAKPGIGLNTCWFNDNLQQWYYMYSVMTILIFANIAIFIYTSVHLWRLSFSSSHVKALKYKFSMCLRMFLIMGITWIFEMISSLTANNVIWFVIDVFNALQGPLIFILLVVFRKRVIKALLRRGYLSCIAGPVERYLAVKEDDEEGVIQHTIDVTMNDRDLTQTNGI